MPTTRGSHYPPRQNGQLSWWNESLPGDTLLPFQHISFYLPNLGGGSGSTAPAPPVTGAVGGSRSSGRSPKRKMRGSRSPRRSGGYARPGLEPATASDLQFVSSGPGARRSAFTRLFKGRCGFSAAVTGSTPTRSCGRIPTTVGAVGAGHVGPRCTAAAPNCALCEERHITADRRRPVESCRVGRGRPCPHGVAKCKNCGGPHLSQANACPEKRRARQEAGGGGCLPHHAGSGRLRG